MAFNETFTAASFTNLEALSGWTRGSGTAGDAYVNSNRLSNAHSGGADAYFVCTSQGSANHFTQAAVHGSGGGFICVRLTDASNFIGFRHDSSTGAWQVFKRVAGSFTQLGTDYVAALVAGDVGKLDANGDTLIFTVNGTQRCLGAGVTETFNNTEVRQGVVARGTTSSPWIDDFLAQGPVVDPVITGPSGAAGAGSSTANIAENASTGPTFTTDIALGGGYPTLTGAQAANWAITALSSTSWRVDPVAPFNFEAGGLVNPQAIVFNASASVSQSCSVTVTNVNEAPAFSGTVSVPTLTQGSAMTPVNAGALFSDPDSGDTAAYSAVGVWPAGVTVDGSTGIISGTPSAAATYANLRVRRTDAGTLTADSNLFTITVAASGGVTFTGTVPAQSGTVGAAFSLALASYFSGTGTYEVQAGTLPPGLARDINTGAITGTPTTAGTYSGVVIRKTAASGSPATADTNAFAFTIAAAPAVAGFDMDTAAGCVFGSVAGSLTSISREVSVAYKVAVYNTSTRALIFESASLTTNSAGRLPRFTTGLCTIGVTYDLVAKRVSDGAIACFRLAAT